MIAQASRDSSTARVQRAPVQPGPAPTAPAQATVARSPLPAGDRLGRTLAAAVGRRGPDEAAPMVLARTRTKQTTKPAPKRKSDIEKKPKKKHKKQTATQAALAVVAAPGPRRSGRQRFEPDEHKKQIHWTGPTWGTWDAVEGGTSVRADLGPAAGQTVNRGGVPEEESCTAVNWLNLNTHDGKVWIKGHLLNDNLGGWGVSKNLTPMTHTANVRFQGAFESKVKNALQVCYSRASFGLDGRGHYYGVSFAVDVVGQAWPDALDDEVLAVGDHVVATASYIEKIGAAAPVPAASVPPQAPALPAGAVTVDCVI